MSTFEEKLKEIRNNLVEVVAKRIEGSIPTKEYDEAYYGFVAQIKQLISETIGENTDIDDYGVEANKNQFRKELRHAFNLKRE